MAGYKRSNYVSPTGIEFEERVVDIWRCSTTMKGGKRFSFAALVVIGSGDGVVGWGYGKAREVPNAIDKAMKDAKKRLCRVPMVGTSIPHEVRGRHGSSEVILVPARPGTGVIAGEGVRAVAECAGIRDLLSKCVGSNNKKNLVKAVFNGLMSLRTKEIVESLRGVSLE